MSETQENKTSKIYDFTKAVFEVEVDVTTNPEKPKFTTHRIFLPEDRNLWKELLKIRDNQTKFEIKEVSSTQEEQVVDDKKANSKLYDKLKVEAAGYALDRNDDTPGDVFRPVDGRLKELIDLYPAHKSAAIKGIHICEAKLEDDDDRFVLSDGDEIVVNLTIGSAESGFKPVRFLCRTPDTNEQDKYSDSATKVFSTRGARKRHDTVHTKLEVSIEFATALIQGVENGVVNGKTFEELGKDEFLSQVDPIYLRLVVNRVMDKFNAKLQD